MNVSLLSDDPVADEAEAAQREALERERFFHDMLIGEQRTGTWVYGPEMPPNYHLFPLLRYLSELDLSEARCLDIGTFDGMTAFALHELGAAEIHATCQYDLPRFRLARALLGAGAVAYYPETEIEELAGHFEPAGLDVAIASAMLHHLPSPLDAVLLCRRLLRDGGFLAIEAVVTEGEGASMMLNTELDEPVFGVPTVWLPTASAMRGMLSLGSFEIVSETLLTGGGRARETNYDRITFLARAVRPAELTGASERTVETLTTQARR